MPPHRALELAEVLKPRKQDVDSVFILRELAARIEQRLEKLVVRRETYVEIGCRVAGPRTGSPAAADPP